MKPIDFRDETYHSLRERISGIREDVWKAINRHGPCTTRELAERSGIDILTVRPRVTELYEMGFVCLAESSPNGRGGKEGVYRARTPAETHALIDSHKEAARTGQMALQF